MIGKRALMILTGLLMCGCLASAQQPEERPRGERASPGQRPQQPLRLPDFLALHEDIVFATVGERELKLDLAAPKDTTQARPLVVFIHGGGWRSGSYKGGLQRLARLLEDGYAGASLGYRLSGEATWPAQIHDVKAGIRWLRANAAEYGIDPERIAVFGTSAGGHLVSMLGTTADDDALEGELGNPGVSSAVTCVIDAYGPSDLLSMNEGKAGTDHFAADAPGSKLLGAPMDEVPDLARQASPLTYVDAGDAPFLILHGDEDRVVPVEQSIKLEAALKEAGVDVELIRVPGAGHGVGVVDRETIEVMRAFLRRHLLAE